VHCVAQAGALAHERGEGLADRAKRVRPAEIVRLGEQRLHARRISQRSPHGDLFAEQLRPGLIAAIAGGAVRLELVMEPVPGLMRGDLPRARRRVGVGRERREGFDSPFAKKW
jgi:hypothetical protein